MSTPEKLLAALTALTEEVKATRSEVGNVNDRLALLEDSHDEVRTTVAMLVEEHNTALTRLEAAAAAPAPVEVFKTPQAAGVAPAVAPTTAAAAPAAQTKAGEAAELINVLLARKPELANRLLPCSSHTVVSLECSDCRKLTLAALAEGNPKLSGLVAAMSGGAGGQMAMMLQLLGQFLS